GERDGCCYFSMKFIEGGQLDEVAKRQPMSLRDAAELIAKLARTVHYAHEHGILHRDIKPGNILIDAKGEPHLTDFGLARLVESKNRSGSFHNLPEMPRERSEAPLCLRPRVGRRSGALVAPRTDSGPALWGLHPRKEMGATESNNCGAVRVITHFCSNRGRDDLEERITPDPSRDCGAAI